MTRICESILAGGLSRNQAIKELYNNSMIKNAIDGIVLKMGGNKNDSLDVFQEAIILFDRNVRENRFDFDSKESTYIISLGKYLWLNRMRKQDRITYTDSNEDLDTVDYSNPEDSMISEEIAREVNLMLKKSGDKCYELLKLWKESVPLTEVAEELGYSSYNAVRKQKHRCMKKLTDLLMTNTHLRELYN